MHDLMALARGNGEDCHRFGCDAMRSCRSLTTFRETLLSASSLYCTLKILALSLCNSLNSRVTVIFVTTVSLVRISSFLFIIDHSKMKS
jgi:hypothetical protein